MCKPNIRAPDTDQIFAKCLEYQQYSLICTYTYHCMYALEYDIIETRAGIPHYQDKISHYTQRTSYSHDMCQCGILIYFSDVTKGRCGVIHDTRRSPLLKGEGYRVEVKMNNNNQAHNGVGVTFLPFCSAIGIMERPDGGSVRGCG